MLKMLLDKRACVEARRTQDMKRTEIPIEGRIVCGGRWAPCACCPLEPAEVASLLLDRGVDVNERKANGGTPLLEAVNVGQSAMVKLLWTEALV